MTPQTSRPALAGAILCGGLSTRMGRDKALLDIDGTTLLERAVARLQRVADPLLLAGGSRGLTHPGCLSVSDDMAGIGPLAGVLAVLRASPHQLCAIVAVDMPDISPELLRRLAALREGEDAVVAVSPRGLEPLHAVYARSAMTAVEDALREGDRSLHGLLRRLRVRRVDAADLIGAMSAARFAVNLNSPTDITTWRRAAGERPPPRPRGAPPPRSRPGRGEPPRSDPR
jgi:molybdenum cofactor guanylyltransferase